MKKLIYFAVVSAMLLFTACAGSDSDKLSSNDSANKGFHEEDAVIEEEGNNYSIKCDNNIYFVTLTDANGKTVQNMGPSNVKPEVTELDNDLVKVSLNPGVEGSNSATTYFNPADKTVSEVLFGVRDEDGTNVILVNDSTVIVRDIFDQSKFDKEITEFSQELSPVTEAIVKAEFSDDGSSVVVTYYTGEEMTEITDTISIN